jgi:hypothetical protein
MRDMKHMPDFIQGTRKKPLGETGVYGKRLLKLILNKGAWRY